MYIMAYSIRTEICIRERPMCVWGSSSLVESLLELQTKQEMCLNVQQSFNMLNVPTYNLYFSSYACINAKWSTGKKLE